MDAIVQDIRFGLRQLRARPGFTVAVVLTLALGIGANTAMFSVLNAVLFRRAPAAQPDRLVWVSATHGPSRRPRGLSLPDYFDVRARAKQVSGMLAYSHSWLSLGGGVPERIRGDVISANYFTLLGREPSLGRAFRPEEDDPDGSHRVAVLSDCFCTGGSAPIPASSGSRSRSTGCRSPSWGWRLRILRASRSMMTRRSPCGCRWAPW
ncbi:MAG TPA: ABC transporter permease [Gemmatimonadales bacterium]|nr:ABC transporter permease [Gemmatimonadales bacterium]